MKIALISDTHGLHGELKIPVCDMIIHAGDFTNKGTLSECKNFIDWYAILNIPYKILIAGNHEKIVQKNPNVFRELLYNTNIDYLEDSACVIEGLTIYGTPWTRFFYDWAFNGIDLDTEPYTGSPKKGEGRPTADAEHPYLEEIYNKIPDNTDILVVHNPPDGLGLSTITDYPSDKHIDVGCKALRQRIDQLNLTLGVYGHIHEARAMFSKETIRNDQQHIEYHVNAVSTNRLCTIVHDPYIIEI